MKSREIFKYENSLNVKNFIMETGDYQGSLQVKSYQVI